MWVVFIISSHLFSNKCPRSYPCNEFQRHGNRSILSTSPRRGSEQACPQTAYMLHRSGYKKGSDFDKASFHFGPTIALAGPSGLAAAVYSNSGLRRCTCFHLHDV